MKRQKEAEVNNIELREDTLSLADNVQEDIITPPERPILGYMTNTEHLSEDGKGIPRYCSKVAIVGFAPSTMEEVQFLFGDPDVEIWPLNQLYMAWPRIVPANRMPERQNVTRWFQIHHRTSYDQTIARDHSHHQWLVEQKDFPIYMMDREPDVPVSCKFPKDQLLEKFRRYFTNSISWEIALAIHEGFKTIYVYGVDMAQDCVAPETKVLTTDLRWVPAGEIKVGQTVMGFDEHSGPKMEEPTSYRQWRSSEVLEANVLERPSYRLYLSDGTQMVASAGHQWLTYSEKMMKWRRTDQLVTNMHREGKPTNLIKIADTWEEDKSWEGGYLAAAFDGEGHLSQHPYSGHGGYQLALGFSQKENAMSGKVEEIMTSMGFDWRSRMMDGGTAQYHINGGKTELMKFLGSIRPLRLLSKFDPDKFGSMQQKEIVAVEKIEFLGNQKVIGFKTSTKTFVAEGFATHNSEYAFERPSVEYWMGYAEGAGAKLVLPEKSDLLKSAWLYPYEDDSPIRTKFTSRRNELQKRVQEVSFGEQQAHDERMQLVGALENMSYVERAYLTSIKDQALWGRR